MKIKLTESQLKRVLKEVGGYDSPEVMATHAGPLHSVISSQTMELLMLVSKLAQGIRDDELSRTELVNGIYNLNEKISQYVHHMPEVTKEIYVDDDFKTVVKSFISALVKINKYFRMLVGSGQNDGGTFYTGLSFDMTQDEIESQVAEQIATLTDRIQEMGMMIMTIHQRFNDRTSSMNENTINESDIKSIVKRVITEQNQSYWDTDHTIMDEDTFNLLYPVILSMHKKNIVNWGKKLYETGYPVVDVVIYTNIIISKGDYNEFTNLENQRIEKLTEKNLNHDTWKEESEIYNSNIITNLKELATTLKSTSPSSSDLNDIIKVEFGEREGRNVNGYPNNKVRYSYLYNDYESTKDFLYDNGFEEEEWGGNRRAYVKGFDKSPDEFYIQKSMNPNFVDSWRDTGNFVLITYSDRI